MTTPIPYPVEAREKVLSSLAVGPSHLCRPSMETDRRGQQVGEAAARTTPQRRGGRPVVWSEDPALDMGVGRDDGEAALNLVW